MALVCVYTVSSWRVVGAQRHCCCVGNVCLHCYRGLAAAPVHASDVARPCGHPWPSHHIKDGHAVGCCSGQCGVHCMLSAQCTSCCQRGRPVVALALAPGLRSKHTAPHRHAARTAAYKHVHFMYCTLPVQEPQHSSCREFTKASTEAASTLQQAHCTTCWCRYFCDVWTYDTDSMQWACHSKGGGPSPRGGHQLALHGDSLFAFGGHTAWVEDGQEREKVHDEVWKLDLKTFQVSGHPVA